MHVLDLPIMIHHTDHTPQAGQTISEAYVSMKAMQKAQKEAAKQAQAAAAQTSAARRDSVASDWTDMTDLKEESAAKKSWLARLKERREKR